MRRLPDGKLAIPSTRPNRASPVLRWPLHHRLLADAARSSDTLRLPRSPESRRVAPLSRDHLPGVIESERRISSRRHHPARRHTEVAPANPPSVHRGPGTRPQALDTDFSVLTEVFAAERLGQVDIVQRSKELSDRAVKIWPRPATGPDHAEPTGPRYQRRRRTAAHTGGLTLILPGPLAVRIHYQPVPPIGEADTGNQRVPLLGVANGQRFRIQTVALLLRG